MASLPLLPHFTIEFILIPIFLLFLFTSFPIHNKHGNPGPFSGRRHAPPPSYPFIGCFVSFYRNRRRLLDWYTHLLADSPTQTVVVSRLGARRIVVTANPVNVEYILKTNFPNFPKGKPFTDLLGDLLGAGIFNADGEAWRSQRRLASHVFTARSLKDFVARTLEEEVTSRLLPLLRSAAESGDVLDLQVVLRKFAFDTICKVCLGANPHCLGPGPASQGSSWRLVEAFDGASAAIVARASAPLAAIWKIKRALNLGSEKKLRHAARVVRDSVREIITASQKNFSSPAATSGAGGRDLLSRLLAAGHDEEAVTDMLLSFMMAGRDTTSSAMTWLFWLLSRHPGAESRAAAEAAGSFSDGSIVDYAAVTGMRFTRACLWEAMRLYPPVAWDSKHAVGPDILPDGTPVGAGDRVTYFPYGMGRMAAIWGEDRLAFRPERWFGGGPEGSEIRQVSPYEYPVFQAGPRVCLGKDMAMAQMNYVVASVLKRFEIRSVRSEPPVFLPLLTARMAGGFPVLVRKRKGTSGIS